MLAARSSTHPSARLARAETRVRHPTGSSVVVPGAVSPLAPVPRGRVRANLFGKRAPAKPSKSDITPFPKDYDQMIAQCQRAVQAALDDGVPLMEIQFPPGGLDTAPGDVEGNVENNLTVTHLRGICAQFERNKTAKTTRVYFPDPIER